MEYIKFKSLKNFKTKILGVLMVLLALFLNVFIKINTFKSVFIYELMILNIVFFTSGFILLKGYTEIEIYKNFNNRRNITLFSKKIFSYSTQIIYPSYISLFGQSFSKSNDFSTISALGSTSEYDLYVIRFFNNKNQREIIFKSENKKEILEKGKQLAELLNVKLVNNI